MEDNKYYTPEIEELHVGFEYYVYRHIRKDINEPFYIGVGKKHKNYSNTIESEYKRAYSKKRNPYWHNIVNKSNGYSIEIMFESNCRDEILEKEVEFIRLYGRKDLGNGCLCNLTDGGELTGTLSPEIEKKRREKISEYGKLRIWSNETKTKISESKKKYVKQYSLDGKLLQEFSSVSDAAKSIGLTISSISKATNNEKYTAGGYRWKR